MKSLKITSFLFIVFSIFNTNMLGSDKSSYTSPEPLKKGGVCFTFDDRHFDNWIKALPLFDKHGVKVSFFIKGNLTSKELTKVKTLQSHGHTIGAHGLKHMKAAYYCKKYGIDKYLQDEIYPQLKIFKKAGIKITSFAYPSSSRNSVTDKKLLKIFRHLRTGGFIKAGERIADKKAFFVNAAGINKHGCLVGKGIDNNIPDKPDRTFKQISDALKKASQNNEIIVFYAHNISDTGKGHHIKPAFLEKIINKAQTLNLKFYSFDQLP